MAFEKYKQFVSEVTSPASSDKDAFVSRIQELEDGGLEIHRLLTGAVGISAEAGEFMEIVNESLNPNTTKTDKYQKINELITEILCNRAGFCSCELPGQ